MPGLAPDLAGKVLSADMRNLVKKVGDGSVMTPAERELIEKAVAEAALPDELQKARRAALIRKWALGGALNKEQSKELAAHLPDARAGAQRLTQESYQHTLRHYAEVLEKIGMPGGEHARRKLKHWIAKGREKSPPDLPPFDNLELMEAWWDRNMDIKAPKWLKGLTADAPPPSSDANVEKTRESTSPPATQPPALSLPTLGEIKVDPDASSDLGVRIFQSVVGDTIRRLNEAAVLKNHREYNRLLDDLTGQVEALRKQEAAALKQAEAKGEALRTRVLTGESVSTLSVLAYSFTNALMILAAKLAPQLPPAERRALVLPLRDDIFHHVRKTRYREAWDETKTKLSIEPAWISSPAAA